MSSEQRAIISAVAAKVRLRMEGETSGHDWWHVYRVWQMAKHICAIEKADQFEVELTALLHDVADWKFSGDELAGSKAARVILEGHRVDPALTSRICDSIDCISFKGTGEDRPTNLEGQIVQDSDRLDALGAVGIARAFAYAGHIQEAMHDPNIKPNLRKTKQEHMKNNGNGTVINHFYEKLLLLKDRMNTAEGKHMAESRHKYMKEFLERFYTEWDGKN